MTKPKKRVGGGFSVAARDVHINQAQSFCSPEGDLDMLLEFG